MLRKLLGGSLAVIWLVGSASAQIKLPAIISDHMVVQAGSPLPIWGMATPGAEVTVSMAAQKASTRAQQDGRWSLTLEPLQSSASPTEMTITEAGQTPLVIHDVLVGEVWVGAGQSNMGFGLSAMQGKEKVLETATNPQLRLFTVKHMTAAEPIGMHAGQIPGDIEGKWQLSDPATAAGFSAVAYLFGAELQKTLQRPVGMISDNWGGTPIKTWMSVQAFQGNSAFDKYVAEYHQAIATHKELLSSDPQNQAKYAAVDRQWHKEIGDKLDADMKVWNAAGANGQNAGPKPKPRIQEPQNPDPTEVPLGGYRPQSTGVSWNGMFAPIIPYAVKGVLWYQGEANVSGYREYGPMLHAMVADWRRQWSEPMMEFLVVQLPGDGENGGTARNLAHMREAQASILDVPHTGLAVTYDVGDPGNVHPANKIDVAHRLTLIALAKVYGEKVAYSGPVMQSATPEGARMRVRFTDINGRLVIGQAPWVAVDAKQFPSDRLIGFELAGADHVYHPALATIDGDSVVLSADSVNAPRYVRYAFDETPRANLYDSAGLPAAPFRTGNEP